MDFKQIQDLIKMINKSNIGELTIEEKDFKITIKQKKDEKLVAYWSGRPRCHACTGMHCSSSSGCQLAHARCRRKSCCQLQSR